MTTMKKEILEQPEVLSKLEKANRKTLTDIVAVLKNRNIKNIAFAGRGSSDHAAIFGQYLFAIKGKIPSTVLMPSCVTVYQCEYAFENHLVIGISQSGMAEDVIAVMKNAKKSGAVTLAITNDVESPLAKTAEFHLFCNAGKETAVAATKTFTAQLGLLIFLCAYWFDDETLKTELNSFPGILKRFLDTCEERIDLLADRYKDITDGFIVSRGISYPAALESVLKFQETCYAKIQGYPVSDFHHGPIAQIDKNSFVIVYATKGMAEKDNLAMIEELNRLSVRPLVVTDESLLCEKYENSFLLPDCGNEYVSPLLLAVFAQCFAENLCSKKGYNTDAPRNIKKITVTI